jgi:hypothetical protein
LKERLLHPKLIAMSSNLNFLEVGVVSTRATGFKSVCLFRKLLSRSSLLLALIVFMNARSWGQSYTDNASNYGGSWSNGSNNSSPSGGFGSWSISAGTSSGVFIGNPANNGMGTIGIGTTAFAMYATGSGYCNVSKSITGGMTVGDVLTFYWAMNFDAGSGNKGFDLKNGGTTIFNVNNAGSSTITTTNGTAFTNYGTTPMFVTVTRTSSSMYSFSMTARDGGATYSTTFNYSSSIDLINLYIGNQNDGAGQKNIFFNLFKIQKPVTTTNGDWNNASTWLAGSVPPSGADVFIDHDVTINSSVSNSPAKIIVNSGKSLTFGASGNVTATSVTNNGSVVMTNGGTLAIATGGTLANGTNSFTRGNGTVTFAGTGTVSGTIGFNNVTIAGGVDFGGSSSTSTIYGILTINNGGFVNTNAPKYAAGSTLKYNSGTTYGRYLEWNSTVDNEKGYPHHVQISNNTILDLGNGGPSTTRQISGNLIIDAGGKINMALSAMTAPLIVSGSFTNNGETILSPQSNGDLKIGGDITNNGTFTHNDRSLYLIGNSTQNIAGNLSLSYFRINQSNAVVTLANSLIVANELSLTSGILDIANHNLTVGSIAGGSASSYIRTSGTGQLKQSISSGGSKSFPVGNSTYNPVTIVNNTGTSDDFTVGVLDEVYANGSSGTTVTRARVQRTWNIGKGAPSANAGTGVALTFNWNNGETNSPVGTPRVFYYNSGTSSWEAQTTGTYTSGTNTLTYTGYMGTFSPFSVMDNSTPLPVTFTSITGTIRNGRANLNWTIADEHNVDRYEVEESANGRQFQSFTQVDAASRSSYQATDAQLFSGTNYYRVKAVDIDGKLTYSKIIRLDNNSAVDNDIRVYPNPSRGELNLGLNIPAGNYQIRLINAVGQTVYQQPLTHEGGSRSMQLGLPKLSSGVYQVEVRGGVQKHVRTVRIE